MDLGCCTQALSRPATAAMARPRAARRIGKFDITLPLLDGRLPGALLDALDQAVDGFADGQVQYLAVERRVVAGGAAEADDFTVGQRVLARAGGGIDHFGG